MSEDRPGDEGPLGFGADDGDGEERPQPPRAAALLAAGDEPIAPSPRRAGLPPGISRYGWFLGIVLVLVLIAVTVNSLRTEGASSRGLRPGEPAPAFAAPLAGAALEGDVNVATEAGQGSAGEVPACSIRRPDVLTSCGLYERRPVALAFFAIRGGSCLDQLDIVERVRSRHPGIEFAAISIRGDRDELRRLMRSRGWGFPIGYDRDGVLANIYGVAVCPQITLLRRGGKAFDTILGKVGAAELDARLTDLERGRRTAGSVPPS